jgi:hypothetical protein
MQDALLQGRSGIGVNDAVDRKIVAVLKKSDRVRGARAVPPINRARLESKPGQLTL